MRVGGADFMHDPLFDLHLLCKDHDIIYKNDGFFGFCLFQAWQKNW